MCKSANCKLLRFLFFNLFANRILESNFSSSNFFSTSSLPWKRSVKLSIAFWRWTRPNKRCPASFLNWIRCTSFSCLCNNIDGFRETCTLADVFLLPFPLFPSFLPRSLLTDLIPSWFKAFVCNASVLPSLKRWSWASLVYAIFWLRLDIVLLLYIEVFTVSCQAFLLHKFLTSVHSGKIHFNLFFNEISKYNISIGTPCNNFVLIMSVTSINLSIQYHRIPANKKIKLKNNNSTVKNICSASLSAAIGWKKNNPVQKVINAVWRPQNSLQNSVFRVFETWRNGRKIRCRTVPAIIIKTAHNACASGPAVVKKTLTVMTAAFLAAMTLSQYHALSLYPVNRTPNRNLVHRLCKSCRRGYKMTNVINGIPMIYPSKDGIKQL